MNAESEIFHFIKKAVIIIFIIGTALLLISGAGYINKAVKTITQEELESNSIPCTIYDQEGNKIAKLQNEYSSYFINQAISDVVDDLQEQKDMTLYEALTLVYQKGVSITITQDPRIQKILDEAVENPSFFQSENQEGLLQVGMVLIDYHTGQVKALVGGREEEKANKVYNRVTQGKRKVGKEFQPIITAYPDYEKEGITLLDLTADYGSVAHQGKYVEPIFYTKVVDYDGKLILENMSQTYTVMNAETAQAISSVVGNISNASETDMLSLGTNNKIPMVATAGTSEESNDLICVGYTPYYVTGVWMGYDDPHLLSYNNQSQTLLWREIVETVHQKILAVGSEGKEFTDIVDLQHEEDNISM